MVKLSSDSLNGNLLTPSLQLIPFDKLNHSLKHELIPVNYMNNIGVFHLHHRPQARLSTAFLSQTVDWNAYTLGFIYLVLFGLLTRFQREVHLLREIWLNGFELSMNNEGKEVFTPIADLRSSLWLNGFYAWLLQVDANFCLVVCSLWLIQNGLGIPCFEARSWLCGDCSSDRSRVFVERTHIRCFNLQTEDFRLRLVLLLEVLLVNHDVDAVFLDFVIGNFKLFLLFVELLGLGLELFIHLGYELINLLRNKLLHWSHFFFKQCSYSFRCLGLICRAFEIEGRKGRASRWFISPGT